MTRSTTHPTTRSVHRFWMLPVALAIVLCAIGTGLERAQASEPGLARGPSPASPVDSSPAVASEATAPEAPIAMSDPSGQGLTLEALDVRVAAHGPLALTELDMVFRNPLARQIEGKFTCMLPTGATLSRFAKEVNGALMEGEVVERLRATQVYTEILQSMRDPALLEQDQGNRFKARVFPIGPNATVRLVLSYSSVNPVGADGQRHIVVPLRGLPKIGHFKFLAVCRPLPGETVLLADASGQSHEVVPRDKLVFADEANKTDFAPASDITLSFKPKDGAPQVARVLAGDFQMTVFHPTVSAAAAAGRVADWHILFDTSASGADSGSSRLDTWKNILDTLDGGQAGTPVQVEAFDLDVAPVADFTTGSHGWAKAMEVLRARHFLGATDLAKVLKHVGDAARSAAKSDAAGHDVSRHNFVLVTDGIPTLGSRDAGDLVRALGQWPASCTLHVLVIGPNQDATITAALAKAGHGRVVTLAPSDSDPAAAKTAVMELSRALGVSFQVYDEGAEWIEPKTFDDVRPGVELVAFSRLKKNAKPQVGLTDGHGQDLRAEGPAIEAPDFAPLLEREAYRAYLTHLQHVEAGLSDEAKKAELRQEQVTISVEHRVLCPLTSLLVLENEWDYQRYGIARKALADILAVGKKGIELIHRQPKAPPAPETSMLKRVYPRKAAMRRHASMDMASPLQVGSAGGESAPQPRPMQEDEAKAEPSESFDRRELHRFPDAGPGGGGASGGFANLGAGDGRADTAASASSSYGGEGGGGTAGAEVESAREAELAPAPSPAMPAYAPPPPGVGAAAPMSEARLMPPPAAPPEPANYPVGPGGGPAGIAPAFAPPRPVGAPNNVDAVRGMFGERAPGAGQFAPPEWIKQAGWRPSDADLADLHARIAKNPLDRGPRNALAYALLKAGKPHDLVTACFDWQRFDGDNPQVYEYLGDAFAALHDHDTAMRGFSSIAEVSPGDDGLLNRAGYLALRAGDTAMAETLLRVAIERRPDHANNYRGLALALWTAGRYEDALKALSDGLARNYHPRYGDVHRVLREEAGIILGAWLKAVPGDAAKVKETASRLGADPTYHDAIRFALHWETDGTDVDLHVVDPSGEECYYSHKVNRSGVTLYEDLTQGLGPETIVVPPGRLQKGVYHVGVNYFSAGPMGVSRGIVVILWPTKDGKPVCEIEPFCLLPDLAGVQRDMRHVAVVESAGVE